MCTYNGEKYLIKQLDSIVKQTYSNIELIIIDDCSSDLTFKLLEEYALSYHFIRVYQNSSNVGFNKNFEKGLSLAKGEFIAISDQDDIWYPEKLAKLYEHIGENWLIFSNSALIDETDALTGRRLFGKIGFSDLNYQSILIYNLVTGHTVLLKKEFLKYILPFPSDGYYDWWMGFIALRHRRLVYLDQILTAYRVHHRSVIQQQVRGPGIENNSLAVVNYQSTYTQLKYFYNHLQADHDTVFITRLMSLYSGDLNSLKKISMFFFIFLNYHQLFPVQKRRKFFSLSRLKFVHEYLKEVSTAKHILSISNPVL